MLQKIRDGCGFIRCGVCGEKGAAGIVGADSARTGSAVAVQEVEEIMPIRIHPRPGQILMCDFSIGFKEPEMVKTRPVIVLTPAMNGRADLVTVVALSTTRPEKILNFHCLIPPASLPMLGLFQGKDNWVKADMIYAVGYHRLELVKLGGRDNQGKRLYFTRCLGRETMRRIFSCVLHGLNMCALASQIPE